MRYMRGGVAALSGVHLSVSSKLPPQISRGRLHDCPPVVLSRHPSRGRGTKARASPAAGIRPVEHSASLSRVATVDGKSRSNKLGCIRVVYVPLDDSPRRSGGGDTPCARILGVCGDIWRLGGSPPDGVRCWTCIVSTCSVCDAKSHSTAATVVVPCGRGVVKRIDYDCAGA